MGSMLFVCICVKQAYAVTIIGEKESKHTLINKFHNLYSCDIAIWHANTEKKATHFLAFYPRVKVDGRPCKNMSSKTRRGVSGASLSWYWTSVGICGRSNDSLLYTLPIQRSADYRQFVFLSGHKTIFVLKQFLSLQQNKNSYWNWSSASCLL